ncbi:unnamed protein product, partial [Rotaria sp. Silwood2]
RSGLAGFNGNHVGFGSDNFGNSRTCYYCGKTGRMNRDCSERRIPNRGNGSSYVVLNSDDWDNHSGFNFRNLVIECPGE